MRVSLGVVRHCGLPLPTMRVSLGVVRHCGLPLPTMRVSLGVVRHCGFPLPTMRVSLGVVHIGVSPTMYVCILLQSHWVPFIKSQCIHERKIYHSQ